MILLLLVVSLSYSNSSAQNIPVLNFQSFQKLLQPNNDTVYIINFWATWCKPCIEELPSFEKLNANYQNQKVKVILVSLDFKSQHKSRLIPFVKKNELKSEVLHLDYGDDPNWIDKVSPSWSGAIPATLVIHSNSKTNKFFEKQFTYEELENIIKPLINL